MPNVRAYTSRTQPLGDGLEAEVVLHTLSVDKGLQSRGGLIQLIATPEIVLTAREEVLLHLLLDATKRLSTRDIVEEFYAFGI